LLDSPQDSETEEKLLALRARDQAFWNLTTIPITLPNTPLAMLWITWPSEVDDVEAEEKGWASWAAGLHDP